MEYKENNLKNKKFMLRVESFLDGKLIVKNKLEPIEIEGEINWDYEHKSNSNTYQVYLHSLGIIKDLTQYSMEYRNPSYLIRAKKIIIDWYNKNSINLRQNKAWHEHSVATRISNIIYFQERAREYRLEDNIFQELIKSHCEYLYSEEYYKPNNHGLMMDNALLIAVKYLDDESRKKIYIDKVIYRIKWSLYRDFTKKGVHLENSPEYHRMVMQLFNHILIALKENGVRIDKEIESILKQANNYQSYIVKPNSEFPLIGDTGTYNNLKIKKKYSDFIDYEAGIAILQYKNNDDSTKSTWMSFKSGYHRHTHKHLDDLSINLYMDGNDILIDSGKYSYKQDDPIRKFLISPEAHSTIQIQGKKYDLKNSIEDQFKLKINRMTSKKNHKLVTGTNKLYKDSTITRHSILTNDNHLFLIDNVISKTEELINQIFNINENAVINKIDELTYEIELNNDSYILQTFKRNNTIDINSTIKKGYISRNFGKYVNNERIIFQQKNIKGKFLTILYHKKDIDKIKDISLKGQLLTYKYNDNRKEISL